MRNIFYTAVFFLAGFCSCHPAAPVEEEAEVETVVPVTVTTVSNGPMQEVIDLNATASFLQKWVLKSTVTGYLQTANAQLNKRVYAGQVLFTVKTKEAESIGNTINQLDPNFHFTGVNSIRSNGNGYIAELNHQAGDYVQDGEQLAVITDTRSFVFLLDLPYEMRPYISGNKTIQLLLPDGEQLTALVGANIPVMDSASQTQRIVLTVHASHPIPENLVAKARLIKYSNSKAQYLPKAAVLADETQTAFWVMKMLNDSTAVKVEIKKGMEIPGSIEVLSPVFSPLDKILLTGNFSLPDTARVKVVTPSTTE